MKKLMLCMGLLFLLVSCGGDEVQEPESRQNEESRQGSQTTGRGAAGSGAQVEGGRGAAGGGAQARGGAGGGGSASTFSIETQLVGDIQNSYSIQKIGQILPSQSLDVDAQVAGDVSSIHIKQGDKVVAGQVLISLKDSYSRYFLDVDKAQIDYDKQIITKESQIISIDKNIDDALRNLDDAKRLYENALLTAAEDTKSAEIAFQNSSIVDVSSSAYLTLESAQLDYDAVLVSIQQSLDGFIRDAQEEYNKLYLSMIDVIEYGDELYGVTNKNRDRAQEIETYFGVLDYTQKRDTKLLLGELMDYSEYLQNLDTDNISESNIVSFMETYDEGYTLVNTFLNEFETTLNNSKSSQGILSDSDINGFSSQVNNFQSSNQGNISSYGSTLKSINAFLSSYKEEQESALKRLELTESNFANSSDNAEITYNKTLINIDNTLAGVEKNRDSLQASYDNLITDKAITIRSLDNAIASAKNNLTQAQVEYSKLTITSPISGVISSLEIDTGEYINSGNSLFTIISDNATQIEVELSKDERENIQIGNSVRVIYGTEEYTGEVFSLGTLADAALSYDATIVLNEDFQLVGGSAKVLFQDSQANGLSIPFNLVEITGDDLGKINVYSKDGGLEKIEVELGNIQGSNIEILTDIPENTLIITTDISNYNPNTQTLTIQ